MSQRYFDIKDVNLGDNVLLDNSVQYEMSLPPMHIVGKVVKINKENSTVTIKTTIKKRGEIEIEVPFNVIQ